MPQTNFQGIWNVTDPNQRQAPTISSGAGASPGLSIHLRWLSQTPGVDTKHLGFSHPDCHTQPSHTHPGPQPGLQRCGLQGLRLKDADSGGATPGQHQPRGPRHWNARREADNCCLCPRSAMSPLFISFCLCWTLPSGSHRGLCQLLEGDATRGLTMQRAGGRWPSQAHEESEIVAENICLQGDRKNEDEMPRANVPRDKSQPPSRVPSGRTVFEF